MAQNLTKSFVRDANGGWTCTEPAVFDLPTGRIEVAPGTRLVRGTTFMGIDLAALLDKQREAPQEP